MQSYSIEGRPAIPGGRAPAYPCPAWDPNCYLLTVSATVDVERLARGLDSGRLDPEVAPGEVEADLALVIDDFLVDCPGACPAGVAAALPAVVGSILRVAVGRSRDRRAAPGFWAAAGRAIALASAALLAEGAKARPSIRRAAGKVLLSSLRRMPLDVQVEARKCRSNLRGLEAARFGAAGTIESTRWDANGNLEVRLDYGPDLYVPASTITLREPWLSCCKPSVKALRSALADREKGDRP